LKGGLEVSAFSTATPVLTERIAAFDAELAKQAPPVVLQAVQTAIAEIVGNEAGGGALRTGTLAPPFDLPDARGAQVSLHDLLASGPVVLTFYRGAWCPYCDLTLRAYQQVLPQIRALGANLVAVSPQMPDASLATAEKKNLAFAVLSDAGNTLARQYGLVFEVSIRLDAIHKAFAIDLARSNGDTSNELPVPGTFIVGKDGRIAFAFVDADYRVRLEPAELLRQLEGVVRRESVQVRCGNGP
jgi:peroxiredoxin